MSKAYKCDRCEQYFTDSGKAHDFDIAKVVRANNGFIINAEHLDLCDGCYAMLETFATGEPFGCVVDGDDVESDYPNMSESKISLDGIRGMITAYNNQARKE